jgi:hypothetical protein
MRYETLRDAAQKRSMIAGNKSNKKLNHHGIGGTTLSQQRSACALQNAWRSAVNDLARCRVANESGWKESSVDGIARMNEGQLADLRCIEGAPSHCSGAG